MTKDEFIQKVLHKTWENRASSFDSMDCFGLVNLYYQYVLGFTIQKIQGYEQGADFKLLLNQNIDKQWRQCGRYENDAMAVFYNAAREPEHIGLCIGGRKVLHARGNVDSVGKVEIHNIAALEKLYNKITYHKLVDFHA